MLEMFIGTPGLIMQGGGTLAAHPSRSGKWERDALRKGTSVHQRKEGVRFHTATVLTDTMTRNERAPFNSLTSLRKE